jgi:trans-2,3-dihydro-3-hydroxyanthranilate isomerase
MPDRQIRVVDVFTDKPLSGNQLAVVLDARGLSTKTMQRIAREMNFSETTFVLPPDDPAHAARVRIFAPTFEMRFAGHPTIGTAWVLADEGLVPNRAAEFVLEELVGPISVRGVEDGGRVVFWMTHPRVEFGDVFPHERVGEALNLPRDAFVADAPAQVMSTGTPFLFVAVRDKNAVDAASVDVRSLGTLLGKSTNALFVFARAGKDRLYSRCLGTDIPEDPATGSASGPLGAYAVRYGLVERAPHVAVVSEQGTKMGRQSLVHIRLDYGDSRDVPQKIEVGGGVMPVLKGTMSEFE